MEIKPGYKLTEVGVIPQDWELRELGYIASVAAGGTPSRENPAYWNGEIPWVTTSQIDFNTITNADQHITELGLKNSAAKLLAPGTLLLALYGQGKTRGKVCTLGIQATTNQACASIVVSSALSRSYVFHSLASQYDVIRGLSNSGSQENLNGQIVKSILVPLPPTKAEQEAIAEALSDADALIESLEQLIAKKHDLKQGAMQELLTGKKRLPGFKREWEVKSLGEIGESLIGLTYKPTDVRSDGMLVLRSSNIFEGALRFEDNVFVAMEVPEKILVRSDDILICVRNGSRDLIGKCAKIDERAQGMTFGAFMAVFRTRFHNFVYHQFQSHVIKRQIREHLGATINQITNKSLNSFQIPFPTDEDEQAAIAAVLTDMDAEIAALEAELDKTRQLMQGMMHNLLTGKIRLV
jgi:type I restriction enzyme S subunit